MQVPKRKKETYRPAPVDTCLTPEKYQELKEKLSRLRQQHPHLSQEVQRLAAMGDFSENAGYQLAKSRLRGLNKRIEDLDYLIKRAEIIETSADKESVSLGQTVLITSEGREKEYRILGSNESDPGKGIISRNSPLGAALLGRRLGEEFSAEINGKIKSYKIVNIK